MATRVKFLSLESVSLMGNMEKNVGGLDRTARIVVGALLVVAGVAGLAELWAVGLVVGIIAVLVGVVLFLTGTTQKCPINEATGIDTRK